MRAAAERGYSLAQVDIAYYYKTGLCFPKDYVISYMWYEIAKTNDNFREDSIRELERLMTPTQMEKAQELTRQCIKKFTRIAIEVALCLTIGGGSVVLADDAGDCTNISRDLPSDKRRRVCKIALHGGVTWHGSCGDFAHAVGSRIGYSQK